jgi:Ca2+-binding RTX toxin-like protein
MLSTGQEIGSDSITREVMSDVSGSAGIADFAKGTAGNDIVTHTGAPESYTDIEGFRMEAGNDIVDLSAATGGFEIDLGSGNDIIFGSAGKDQITGGLGDDIFVLGSLPSVTDIITDYRDGDQIDITALVKGVATVTDNEANYDPSTGTLEVMGKQAYLLQGLPNSVEVIFENASGAAEVAPLT